MFCTHADPTCKDPPLDKYIAHNHVDLMIRAGYDKAHADIFRFYAVKNKPNTYVLRIHNYGGPGQDKFIGPSWDGHWLYARYNYFFDACEFVFKEVSRPNCKSKAEGT